MDVDEAIEDILLGESLRSLRDRVLMDRLGLRDEDELAAVLRALDRKRAAELRMEAQRFVGTVCRTLGERYDRDMRICRVLEVWAQESKDYDAFDALLCNFEWPGRARCLAEGRRLFPSTLTDHWGVD